MIRTPLKTSRESMGEPDEDQPVEEVVRAPLGDLTNPAVSSVGADSTNQSVADGQSVLCQSSLTTVWNTASIKPTSLIRRERRLQREAERKAAEDARWARLEEASRAKWREIGE